MKKLEWPRTMQRRPPMEKTKDGQILCKEPELSCEGKSSPSYRPEVAWSDCSVVSALSSLALSAQLTCLLGFFQECFRYLQLRNIRAPSSRSMTNDLVDPSSAILACLTVPEMFHFFVSMSCTRTTSPSRKSLGALLLPCFNQL